MRLGKKILMGILAVLACGVLWLANAFFGNPFSLALVHYAAGRQLAAAYPGYELQKCGYNFKNGDYFAYACRPGSSDQYFSLYYSPWGRLLGSSYDAVETGWNTYRRLDMEYRAWVDAVLADEAFPLESNIDFGTLVLADDIFSEYPELQPYGLELEALEVDGEYDLAPLGAEAGKIVYYAESEVITEEEAARCLLMIKKSLDEAGVSFAAIDFVLRTPLGVDGAYDPARGEVHLLNFPSGEIYEKGLLRRVQQNHEQTDAYYARLDAEAKTLEEQAEKSG